MSPTKPATTEHELYALLERKVSEDRGNGPATVIVPQVRSDAGFDARRTLDAVALSLWPSRGMRLHGYEIKCSRSDWLNELKNPAKAEEFATKLDFFSIVIADRNMIEPGELPETWGLLARSKNGRGLTSVVAPTLFGPIQRATHKTPLPEGFDRGFLVALMRQAARRQKATPAAVQIQIDQAVEAATASANGQAASWREAAEDARQAIADFEKAAGVTMRGRFGWGHDPAELGRTVRLALDGHREAERIEQRLGRLREQASSIVEAIDNELAAASEDEAVAA